MHLGHTAKDFFPLFEIGMKHGGHCLRLLRHIVMQGMSANRSKSDFQLRVLT